MFSGSNLQQFGKQLHLDFKMELTGRSSVSTCVASDDGLTLSCPATQLPACTRELSEVPCRFELRLRATSDDPSTEVRQFLEVELLPVPTLLSLRPTEVDSTFETVELEFDQPESVMHILALDEADNCCVDPAACAANLCRAECRVYTPGRQRVFKSAMRKTANGLPACELPQFGNKQLSCGGDVKHLEIEVMLDSNVLVASRAPWISCRPDTIVLAQSAPQIVFVGPKIPPIN